MKIKTRAELETYIDQEVDMIFVDDMIAILNIIKIF